VEQQPKSFKRIRILTDILLTLPFVFVVLQVLQSLFLPMRTPDFDFGSLCFFTLAPFSLLAIIILAYIAIRRRQLKLKANKFDNIRIHVSISFFVLGIIAWGFIVLMWYT
jgi:hypothetical protein